MPLVLHSKDEWDCGWGMDYCTSVKQETQNPRERWIVRRRLECTDNEILALSLDLPRSLRRGDAWCMHHASNQFDRGGSGIER